MHDPDQAKQAILLATASLSAAFAAMKKEANIVPQSPDHREGVMRGITLCLDAIEEFERNVDEVVKPPAELGFWLLTLPFLDDMHEDDEWKNPYSWPGDWTPHDNRDIMIVAAMDEDEARRLAAEKDCAIWLDPAYAECEPLSATAAGVIISSGGEAENE
jgi:hypothetical protein